MTVARHLEHIRVEYAREPDGAAQRVFGWQRLRPEQLEAMQAILAGRDVLAVMPSGSGKSATY
jgi:ATP-dependent DNA helicase RecQ